MAENDASLDELCNRLSEEGRNHYLKTLSKNGNVEASKKLFDLGINSIQDILNIARDSNDAMQKKTLYSKAMEETSSAKIIYDIAKESSTNLPKSKNDFFNKAILLLKKLKNGESVLYDYPKKYYFYIAKMQMEQGKVDEAVSSFKKGILSTRYSDSSYFKQVLEETKDEKIITALKYKIRKDVKKYNNSQNNSKEENYRYYDSLLDYLVPVAKETGIADVAQDIVFEVLEYAQREKARIYALNELGIPIEKIDTSLNYEYLIGQAYEILGFKQKEKLEKIRKRIEHNISNLNKLNINSFDSLENNLDSAVENGFEDLIELIHNKVKTGLKSAKLDDYEKLAPIADKFGYVTYAEKFYEGIGNFEKAKEMAVKANDSDKVTVYTTVLNSLNKDISNKQV